MKIGKFDGRVHVLDENSDVFSVLKEIAESDAQEDAFYVCDVGDIARKHKIWTTSMPRVEPFYAMKCNDTPAVLQTLAALGASFDCASKTEITRILAMGVSPRRIIFAHPTKPPSHIRHARSTGVDLMTFDSIGELYKIQSLYPSAKLVLRVLGTARDDEVQIPLGMKFGCHASTEAPTLLRKARQLGLHVVGVSFHVGSNCKNPGVYNDTIRLARRVFDLGVEMGFAMDLLDIGGGFPGDKGTSIDEFASVINSALDLYFPEPNIRVISEPGRFYVSSAYTLACNIHSIRDITCPTTNSVTHRKYYINDGLYGSFSSVIYLYHHVVPRPLHPPGPSCKHYFSSIWGPTCAGRDQVLEEVLLPEMQVGDWIVFENLGAYSLPIASLFNGFPVPKVHMVADENTRCLLKDVLMFDDEDFV